MQNKNTTGMKPNTQFLHVSCRHLACDSVYFCSAYHHFREMYQH